MVRPLLLKNKTLESAIYFHGKPVPLRTSSLGNVVYLLKLVCLRHGHLSQHFSSPLTALLKPGLQRPRYIRASGAHSVSACRERPLQSMSCMKEVTGVKEPKFTLKISIPHPYFAFMSSLTRCLC